MRVTAHRRLVDGDLLTPCRCKRVELGCDDRLQRVRDRVAVGVAVIRDEAAAQRVRAGHARLQHGACRGQPAKALPLLDDTEAAGSGELADDPVAPPLVVRRRAEASGGCRLALDPFEIAVEREVEVEARLLAVGDHVESRFDLVVDRDENGVVMSSARSSGPKSSSWEVACSSQPGNG